MNLKGSSSLLFIAGLSLVAACDPQGTGLQKDDSNQVEPDRDENGVTTTKYNSNSTEPQTFQASGSSKIQNANITILPGSLGIDTEISIEEAESIADPDAGANLGLDDTTFTTGGPAVAFTSSLLIDTTQPFTIALPIAPGAGLALTDVTNIVVIYKVTKASDAGGLSLGIIPTSAVKLDGGLAKVETNWFGVYQVAYANKPITDRVEARTAAPIVLKSRSTFLTGRWKSNCTVNHEDEDKGMQTTTASAAATATGVSGFSLQNLAETATQNNNDTKTPDWEVKTYSFSHDRINFSMKMFRDENCQKGILKAEIGGVYQLGGSSPSHPDAKNLDVKIDSLVLTLLNPNGTEEANKGNLCGFSDWVTNKARSVADLKACKFGGDGKQVQQSEQNCSDSPPEPGKTLHTVVRVEGNTLKMGSDSFPNCGRTPETRNSEFSDKAGDILTRF